jgi:hypothetical protein
LDTPTPLAEVESVTTDGSPPFRSKFPFLVLRSSSPPLPLLPPVKDDFLEEEELAWWKERDAMGGGGAVADSWEWILWRFFPYFFRYGCGWPSVVLAGFSFRELMGLCLG